MSSLLVSPTISLQEVHVNRETMGKITVASKCKFSLLLLQTRGYSDLGAADLERDMSVCTVMSMSACGGQRAALWGQVSPNVDSGDQGWTSSQQVCVTNTVIC